jgi:hypothetical protein
MRNNNKMKGDETVGTHSNYCEKRKRTNTQGNGRWGADVNGGGGELIRLFQINKVSSDCRHIRNEIIKFYNLFLREGNEKIHYPFAIFGHTIFLCDNQQ